MAQVYGLVASDRPSEVRYVGQTIFPAERRLRRHVEASHSVGGPKFPVNRWISKVEARGASVQAIVLVENADWNLSEIATIRRLRADGAALLNCTDGGDGGLNPTAETRAKMSLAGRGRRKTDEHRQKISARHKERLLDPVAREQLRLRHVGLKRSAATRAKFEGENNGMAKLTGAIVLSMREAFSSGDSIITIAARHACGYGTCYAAVKGLTWRSL